MAGSFWSARMSHLTLYVGLLLFLLAISAVHAELRSSRKSSSSSPGSASSNNPSRSESADVDEATRKLIAAGDRLLGQGRTHYESALGKYTEALMHDPRNERALFSRAELLVLLRRPQSALSDLDVLLDVAPDSIRARQLRLRLNAETAGQLAAAAQDAAALVTLLHRQGARTKSKEMQHTVEQLRRYAKEWHRLEDVLQPDVDNGPSDAHSAHGKMNTKDRSNNTNSKTTNAHSELMKERYASCVRLLDGVIEEFGKDAVSLRLRRASCALALHRSSAAAPDIRFVLRKEPQNLLAMALNARALRELGALDHALSELRRCLALDPEYAACARLHKRVRAHKRLVSDVEAKMGRRAFAEAIVTIQAGLSAEVDAPYADQLGEWLCDAYVAERDTEKGLQVCQGVLERLGSGNPAACHVYLQLAEIHILEDDLDAAIKSVQAASELNAQHPKINEMKQKLEKLKHSNNRKDYYKILGVKKTASAAEVRRAYRKLAKKHHPDQLRSKNMSEKERARQDKLFRDMNEAKEVLLDAEKRDRYDNGEDVTKPPGQQEHPFYGNPFNFDFPGNNMGNFYFRPGGGGAGRHGPGGGGQGQQQFFFFRQG